MLLLPSILVFLARHFHLGSSKLRLCSILKDVLEAESCCPWSFSFLSSVDIAEAKSHLIICLCLFFPERQKVAPDEVVTISTTPDKITSSGLKNAEKPYKGTIPHTSEIDVVRATGVLDPGKYLTRDGKVSEPATNRIFVQFLLREQSQGRSSWDW